MKVKCEKCGKELDSKGLHTHLRYCKGTLEEAPKAQETANTEPAQQYQEVNINPEIDRLAEFLLKNFPGESGRETSESAVDVAIRLLSGPPSIPLSECPKELEYLRDGQYFFDMTGRKVDGRLVVEKIKLKR
jgi:hypothetical protein